MQATARARQPNGSRGVLMLLRDVGPDAIHIDLHGPDWQRTVSVLISGRVVSYPHVMWDTGTTTGDDDLDAAVRERAKQALILRGGWSRRRRQQRWP
jgi:hypothetical protein